MENKIKKIYFAGKFNLTKNKDIPLYQRLKIDYRSLLLGDAKKLATPQKNLLLDNNKIYLGPFYCEQASNGNFTSTDCNEVLNSEFNYVKSCDLFFAVFDEGFSVGTIVELGWAIQLDKEIVILYKEEDSNYQIKSEYWFAIADALKKSNKVKVYSFVKNTEIFKYVKAL